MRLTLFKKTAKPTKAQTVDADYLFLETEGVQLRIGVTKDGGVTIERLLEDDDDVNGRNELEDVSVDGGMITIPPQPQREEVEEEEDDDTE